jgi:pantothenate synthetase
MVIQESKVLNNASEDEKLELKALKKRYEEEMEAAKEIENEARAALAEKAELEARAAEVRAKAEAAALAASQAKALEAAILAAARKGNV